jgi:hypothetical protein
MAASRIVHKSLTRRIDVSLAVVIDVIRQSAEVLKTAHRKVVDRKSLGPSRIVSHENQLELSGPANDRRKLMEEARAGLAEVRYE